MRIAVTRIWNSILLGVIMTLPRDNNQITFDMVFEVTGVSYLPR